MDDRDNGPSDGSVLIPGTGAVGRRSGRDVPTEWTIVHVMDRLEEAYEILARLPMNTRPRGYANAMPAYVYDRGDLNAQVESGELERMMRLQNRIRISPTAEQIARMEEAIAWPLTILKDMPEVARTVQLGSLWSALRLDPRRQCKRLKINPRFFNKQKMHGVRVIAYRLAVARVAVK